MSGMVRPPLTKEPGLLLEDTPARSGALALSQEPPKRTRKTAVGPAKASPAISACRECITRLASDEAAGCGRGEAVAHRRPGVRYGNADQLRGERSSAPRSVLQSAVSFASSSGTSLSCWPGLGGWQSRRGHLSHQQLQYTILSIVLSIILGYYFQHEPESFDPHRPPKTTSCSTS